MWKSIFLFITIYNLINADKITDDKQNKEEDNYDKFIEEITDIISNSSLHQHVNQIFIEAHHDENGTIFVRVSDPSILIKDGTGKKRFNSLKDKS